jgi:hypothetical protein
MAVSAKTVLGVCVCIGSMDAIIKCRLAAGYTNTEHSVCCTQYTEPGPPPPPPGKQETNCG